MRLALMRPAADIAGWVAGYCLCDDAKGEMAGQVVCATPQVNAVLCLQLGGEVITEFVDPKPLLSYAGVQSGVRRYRLVHSARTLLIFLTHLGSVRLFPSLGRELVDTGYDMGGMIGDGAVARLRAVACACDNEAALTAEIDAWLRARFALAADGAEFGRLAAAMDGIGGRGHGVARVAARLDLSERQLERSFVEHLGVGPKRYQQIHRISRSLGAVLSGRGDPLEGFADQAHQIRTWRSFLGFTPGDMKRRGPSPLGSLFTVEASAAGHDWAHYL